MKLKKLISALVVCLLMATVCCGCAKAEYTSSLEEAYENGYITEEHLRSIAFYWNNRTEMEYPEPDFELIPKTRLSKSQVNSLKRAYLKRYVKDDYPLATINCVNVFMYYGTYNGYAVVFMLDNKRKYDIFIVPEKEIGGVMFYNFLNLSVYYIG